MGCCFKKPKDDTEGETTTGQTQKGQEKEKLIDQENQGGAASPNQKKKKGKR